MRIGTLILRLLLPGAALLATACATTTAPVTSSGTPLVAPGRGLHCKGPPIQLTIEAFGYQETRAGDIGEGLAQMLADALSDGECFVIVRGDQPPGQTPAAAADASGAAAPAALRVEGSIRLFQAPCKGGSLIVLAANQACVKVDLSVVDAASGVVVHSTTASGDSAVPAAGLNYARGVVPPALGAYNGTPMEQAIRNCVESAAGSIAYWYLTGQP